jgi:secreted trypsin-like serine protease
MNSDFTIVAGLHSQIQPDPQRIQRKQILTIVHHQEYDRDTNKNDIAIIRLASPVILNSYVNVACLPQADPNVNDHVMVGM